MGVWAPGATAPPPVMVSRASSAAVVADGRTAAKVRTIGHGACTALAGSSPRASSVLRSHCMPNRTPCGETQYRLSRVSELGDATGGRDEVRRARQHQRLVGLDGFRGAIVADQPDQALVHADRDRQAASADDGDRRLPIGGLLLPGHAGHRIGLGVDEIQLPERVEADVEHVDCRDVDQLVRRDQRAAWPRPAPVAVRSRSATKLVIFCTPSGSSA